jgi:hypothetical protein
MRRGLRLLLSLSAAAVLAWPRAGAAKEGPEREINRIALPGSVAIVLPDLPADEGVRAEFLSLSGEQRNSFYLKRALVIRKFALSLAKPGLRDGFAWIRNKLRPFRRDGGEAAGPALSQMEWESKPDDLSPYKQARLESAVNGLIESMWRNSRAIASANGIGFTFVGGAIFNTSLAKWGFVWGRALSVDIGVDFKTQTGYIRTAYDRQSLKRAGVSFDVGLMFDMLLHFTNTDPVAGEEIAATHTKLPLIGCFRHGPDYSAWGMQMGLGALETLGAWVAWTGLPAAGAAMAAANRAVGAVTVYSTRLDRRILRVRHVPARWLKFFGLSSWARDLRECEKDLSSSGT